MSAEQAASAMEEWEFEILCQPRFTTGVDESYLDDLDSVAWRTPAHPVFTSTPRGLRWCFDAALDRGEDPEAATVLAKLVEVVKQSQHQVVLEPGDMLCVDNSRVVHGRTPYTPRYDGNDRWLQRALVRREITSIPDEHYRDAVITTLFR